MAHAKHEKCHSDPIREKRKAAYKKQEPDDFISVARRLEADEDKATFEAKLAKIAKPKGKSP